MDRNNFIGLDRFIWWVGVIENRASDPLGIGRCQVRIFGWHTDNTSALPTKDLPWAHPVYPLNNSKTFASPQRGDWVIGFFMDGESGQYPIMLGVMPAITGTDAPSATSSVSSLTTNTTDATLVTESVQTTVTNATDVVSAAEASVSNIKLD